jgi:hypothetical protein
MNNDPFQFNIFFCPTCDEEREPHDVSFVETVEELGGVLRYRCKICNCCFEKLPPGPPLPRTPPAGSSRDG